MKKRSERKRKRERERERKGRVEAEKVFVAPRNWNVRSAYYKSTEEEGHD